MALIRVSVATAVALVLATNARTASAQARPTTAAQANAAQLSQAQGGVAQPISDADKLADDMRVIGASPNDIGALADAGERSLQLGDLSGAASLFARADKVDPRNGRIKAGMASLLLHSERPGEALRYFDQAEGYGFPVARFAAERGLAYDLIGQQQRAQRDYRTALATTADDETVRRLALSLGISGRASEALKELEPLLRRNDRGAWRARAFVLAMAGDVAGASNIATTMMPGGVAQGLRPFFERLPTLPATDRAFAVHFGEVRATPQRLADARLAPALAPLPPEVRPPVAVAANTVAAPVKAGRGRDRKRRGREEVAAATVPVAVPAPVRTASVATPAPASSRTVRATTAPVAVAAHDRRPTVRIGTLAMAPYPGFTGFVPDRPAPRSTTSRIASVVPPAPLTVAPSVVMAAPRPIGPSALPTAPAPTAVQLASVAPTRTVAPIATPTPTPRVSSALPTLTPAPTAVQLASAASPRAVAPAIVTPTPRVAALPTTTTPPASLAVAPVVPRAAPAQAAALPAQVAATPPAVATATAAATTPPAASSVSAVAAPAPATLAATPAPAPAAAGAVPTTERSVAANAPASRLHGEDAILARIIANISVPASELGVDPVPRPAVAPAPAPVAAPAPVVAAAVPTRPVASRRDLAVAPTAAVPDLAADQAAARKAAADKKLADRRAAAKAAADKKAAAAKALADQQAADERKAAAEEKKAARTNPSRIWVQVAGGANEGDLEKAWSGARGKASALQGHSGWTTPLRATNRVLTGPFKTDAEARAFVNQLAKQGVSAFPFTSDQGQKVTKLGGR